jgi:hypothetical protein
MPETIQLAYPSVRILPKATQPDSLANLAVKIMTREFSGSKVTFPPERMSDPLGVNELHSGRYGHWCRSLALPGQIGSVLDGRVGYIHCRT